MKDRLLIAYEWRWYWFMMALFAIEIPLTISLLALFGIADNDTYSTKLWQNGADQGFNSAPSSILYDYANYRPATIPMVWSTFNTQFNIVCIVLSMFFLLTKTVMYLLHVFIPIISVIVHAILVALFAVSVRNQSTPDNSDPEHPSPGGLPWYISKGCSYATSANYGYCMQARAAFAVSCTVLGLFSIYFIWSIYNLIPTTSEKAERTSDRNLAIELKTSVYDPEEEEAAKRRRKRRTGQSHRGSRMFPDIPKTPNTAVSTRGLMTPRTKAFSVLNGGGAGEASAIGRKTTQFSGYQVDSPTAKLSTGVGPSRPLAFREQYSDGATRSP